MEPHYISEFSLLNHEMQKRKWLELDLPHSQKCDQLTISKTICAMAKKPLATPDNLAKVYPMLINAKKGKIYKVIKHNEHHYR